MIHLVVRDGALICFAGSLRGTVAVGAKPTGLDIQYDAAFHERNLVRERTRKPGSADCAAKELAECKVCFVR